MCVLKYSVNIVPDAWRVCGVRNNINATVLVALNIVLKCGSG